MCSQNKKDALTFLKNIEAFSFKLCGIFLKIMTQKLDKRVSRFVYLHSKPKTIFNAKHNRNSHGCQPKIE